MINKTKLKMTVISLSLASLISGLPANNTAAHSSSKNNNAASIEQNGSVANSNR